MERNIGFIKNLITATKGIGFDIIVKFMQFISYMNQTRNFSASPIAKVLLRQKRNTSLLKRSPRFM